MRIAMAGLLALALSATPLVGAEPPAKKLFGAKVAPAAIAPEPVGSYAKGCLAGGAALAWNGPNHQVMRLSRNRYWGHPVMIDYLGRLGAAAGEQGWPGLLVGDIAQPRGGPMLFGHASHQIGLDADIWLKPMPDHLMSDDERENVSAVSMLNEELTEIDREHWTPLQGNLIKSAARFPEVARIFAHPVIKRELCETAGDDRAWLRKVRPWWGHHYHFHVRLSCPDGARGCVDQAAPPPGDGCGKELTSWFKAAAKPKTPPPPRKKKPDLVVADLPAACGAVLEAQ
jgi:penicillin-insensitive murein endopeptidase